MEEDQNEIPMNNQGRIDGCSIAAFGLFTFFVGLGLLTLGVILENGLLLIIGLFLGTLVAGFLILYPIVRLLFGGKDSVAKMEWLSKSKIAYPRELVDLNIGPYVVLAPGCSTAKPQKRWPAKRFAALANMFDKKDYTVILTGTEADRNAVEEVKSIAQNVIDFCQKTNLSDLCDLLYHADFVVGNDSGPVFLAAKAGVPTLMVMGPDTNPKMSAPIGAKASWLRANPIDLITEFEAFNEFRRLSRLKG